MSFIKIKNLSFSYGDRVIFENVNLNFDQGWKLGLISRNGRGKSTLLKILSGMIEDYSGIVESPLKFYYCPMKIENENLSLNEIILQVDNEEIWKIYKESELLNLNLDKFELPYNKLSGGEQVKFQLAIAFASEKFALLDEPTNHLDQSTKEIIKNYLHKKTGFILVSHDRWLLDEVTDHILSINKSSIDLVKGNYSTWKDKFDNKILNEEKINDKLQKEINQLAQSKTRTENWAKDAEKEKFTGKFNKSGVRPDRGFVGKRASKVMKTSKNFERRVEKDIEQKSKLLKDIDREEELKLFPLFTKGEILSISNLTKKFDNRVIFKDLNLSYENGQRLAIVGDNGSGKSTLLNIILGIDKDYYGNVKLKNNIKISYLGQSSREIKGNLKSYAQTYGIELSLLCSLIRKLEFEKVDIDMDIENLSEGEKKKIMLARSLAEKAHLYIWDEPFNYIDIPSRLQIEKLILQFKPNLIFVEHDKNLIDKIATNILKL